MDLATFRAMCPEMRTAGDDFVQAYLDEAAGELNATEYGGMYDAAHRLLTAHKIAVSPFGRASRMVNDKGESTYEAEFIKTTGRAVTALSVMGGTAFPYAPSCTGFPWS